MRWLTALALLTLVACDDGADQTRSDAAPPPSPEPAPAPEPTPDPPVGEPDAGPEPEPEVCVSTVDFYAERVWAPVFQTTCVACHVADGVAGDTRLLLQGPADYAADLAALRPLAEETVRDTSLLLLKPSAAHPEGHGGGMVLSAGSQGYRDLAHLAERLTGARDDCGRPLADEIDPPDAPADCVAPPPGVRSLRRLSHAEYANTIRDLLGVVVDPERLSADRVVHGFDNNAGALTVTGLLADQYRGVAEDIVTDVEPARLVECANGRACAAELLQTTGARLFRRPLTADEVERYLAIYDLAATEGFAEGVRWVLVALLQSPHFLYRTELGRRVADGFALTPYEIAAELSYLFWETAPDDALWAAAASGALLEPAAIAEQAARLLADPRSAGVMTRFGVQWLAIDDLAVVPRDPEVYPELTPALRAAMAEETERFLGHLWAQGGGLGDLFSAQAREMNPLLAEHYGLPAPDGWAAVDLSDTPYGGILTHGSVLTSHALPGNSSPIHRGLMVRERFLCQELPDPPANLDTSPPPVDPTLSTRERYAQHASDPACAGCHDLVDPIGYAFEHFDGIGRYRERDGMHVVDASGAIKGLGEDRVVDGLHDLGATLADTPEVQACYIKQWIRYGYGIDDSLPMDCYVNHVGRDLSRLSDVLPALAAQAHFRHRIGGDAEEDVPGAELTPSAPGEVVEPPMIEPQPEPEPEVGPGEATLELREASRWGTGYCMDAVVTNPTDGDLEWTVTAEVEGRINNLWNAEGDGDSGRVTFRGLDWNGTLGAGQRADFGWCAEL